MKKSIFTLAIASMCFLNTYAKVWTVSQDGNLPGQFTTVQLAINAAATHAGDTIYINGSLNPYAGFDINKPNLTFIGAGYAPNKDNPNPTRISSSPQITLDTTGVGQTGRGAKFIGMNLYNVQITNANSYGAASNVVISRCILGSVYVYGNNWMITDCILTSWVNLQNYSNVFISNNIFGSSAYVSNSTSANVLLTNNLIFTDGIFLNSTFQNATISNNIIINSTLYNNSSYSGMKMNNNISVTYFNVNLDTLNSRNVNTCSCSMDTIVNLSDMMFANVTGLVSNSSFSTSYYYGYTPTSYDFHLLPGSVALNYHGVQVGIYGGFYPWTDFSGMAQIPFVQHMTITSVVPQTGGQIQVNVTPKTHN